MPKINLPEVLRPLAEGLSAVSTQLEPKDAAEIAATLTQAMTMTMGGQAIPVTADGKIKITIGPAKDK